jgi:hypothetical protein
VPSSIAAGVEHLRGIEDRRRVRAKSDDDDATRISSMRSLNVTRLIFALALCWAAAGHGADGRADPLLTQGVGIANCGKLANDLKPSQGLDHPPNYLLFYWVQGYVSGANFLLLNDYNNYVDMNDVVPGKILKLVFDFCKANPNDKPISAIDKFIRDAKKVEVSEKEAFNPWEQ